MALEGVVLPAIPPVSYATHEHCWVKRGGARLAASHCLAKGWRAGSREAKKQLQKALILSYHRGRRSRGAGVSPERSLEISVENVRRCAEPWAHVWDGGIPPPARRLKRYPDLSSLTLHEALLFVAFCWPAGSSMPTFSSDRFGRGRQTRPPETSSQQCDFKDKVARHCKAF